MASLFHDSNGTARILFTHDGKRKTIRLGTVPKAQAREAKVRVESLVAAQQTGSVDVATQLWLSAIGDEMADRLYRAGLIPKRVTRTLAGLLDDYCARRGDMKPATRQKHEQIRADLLRFAPADTDIRSVTVEDAEGFKAHLQGRGLAGATVARRLTEVRSVFGEAKRLNLIDSNPFETVKARSVLPEDRKVYIPIGDAARLIDAARPEWRVVVALCRFGGLRCPSEVLSLKWSDVNWETKKITVPSPKTEHLEGKAYRVIPIFTELRPHLEYAFELASDGTEFVASGPAMEQYRDKSGAWDSANLGTTLKRFIRLAGLEEWPKPFHNLRASCETDLLNKYSIHIACAWIGNSPTVALRHYATVRAEDFDRAAQKAAHSDSINASQTLSNSLTESMKTSETLEIKANSQGPDWALLDLNHSLINGAKAHISDQSGTKCGTLKMLIDRWPQLTPEQRETILETAGIGVGAAGGGA